ncbi:Ecdysone-induced protein 63F 1 [Carabus blaptoides fortunei]
MSKTAPNKQKISSTSKDFTETELQDLRTAFDLLDRNQDGRVTIGELQFMLQNLGIEVREEVVQELIKEVTQTGAGLMNETEFLQWISRIQSLRQEPESDDDECNKDLIAAFRVFDRDCNGYITRDELRSAMDMIGEQVTDQQLNDLLTLADVDMDGKINYEEFARLLL